MLSCRLVAAALLLAGPLAGQKLSFEVADVKISPPGGTPNADFLPGGKITVTSLTMRELISAYSGFREDYIFGGPDWLNKERYDIVAKAPNAAPEHDLQMMLQALLEERFQLQTHTETRVMPLYVLTAPKGAAKLKESASSASEEAACKLQTPQQRKDGLILRTWTCTNASLATLAGRLSAVAANYVDQQPVIDQTGLKGRYDFTLEWAPLRAGRGAAMRGEAPPAADPDGPTIFNAIQNQLGLKLEPRKLPVNVLVIDRVERIPKEN